jgi:hypothetical protein
MRWEDYRNIVCTDLEGDSHGLLKESEENHEPVQDSNRVSHEYVHASV